MVEEDEEDLWCVEAELVVVRCSAGVLVIFGAANVVGLLERGSGVLPTLLVVLLVAVTGFFGGLSAEAFEDSLAFLTFVCALEKK